MRASCAQCQRFVEVPEGIQVLGQFVCPDCRRSTGAHPVAAPADEATLQQARAAAAARRERLAQRIQEEQAARAAAPPVQARPQPPPPPRQRPAPPPPAVRPAAQPPVAAMQAAPPSPVGVGQAARQIPQPRPSDVGPPPDIAALLGEATPTVPLSPVTRPQPPAAAQFAPVQQQPWQPPAPVQQPWQPAAQPPSVPAAFPSAPFAAQPQPAAPAAAPAPAPAPAPAVAAPPPPQAPIAAVAPVHAPLPTVEPDVPDFRRAPAGRGKMLAIGGAVGAVALIGILVLALSGSSSPPAPEPAASTPPAPSPPPTVAPPQPAPTQARPSVPPGTFDRAAAQAALAKLADVASECRKPSDPKGVARIKVTFEASGKAAKATVEKGAMSKKPLSTCLEKLFKNAEVPPFSGEPVDVTQAVVLR